ncbi:MAG TPA: PH domain-containing protein [Chthoniobacterales bacterium]
MSETVRMNEPASATAEQTLWTGSVSNFHYAGKWVLVLILLAIAGASFLLALPNYAEILWGGRAALVIVALLIAGWIQLDRSRRKYTVTNRRVSVEFGIVSRTSNEVRLQDIRSINLRRHGLSGLFGIGTVEFSSAATDDADVIFWNIAGAEKVRDLVRSLQT